MGLGSLEIQGMITKKECDFLRSPNFVRKASKNTSLVSCSLKSSQIYVFLDLLFNSRSLFRQNGAWGCLKFNLKLVECQLNPRGRSGEGGEIPGQQLIRPNPCMLFCTSMQSLILTFCHIMKISTNRNDACLHICNMYIIKCPHCGYFLA